MQLYCTDALLVNETLVTLITSVNGHAVGPIFANVRWNLSYVFLWLTNMTVTVVLTVLSE